MENPENPGSVSLHALYDASCDLGPEAVTDGAALQISHRFFRQAELRTGSCSASQVIEMLLNRMGNHRNPWSPRRAGRTRSVMRRLVELDGVVDDKIVAMKSRLPAGEVAWGLGPLVTLFHAGSLPLPPAHNVFLVLRKTTVFNFFPQNAPNAPGSGFIGNDRRKRHRPKCYAFRTHPVWEYTCESSM